MVSKNYNGRESRGTKTKKPGGRTTKFSKKLNKALGLPGLDKPPRKEGRSVAKRREAREEQKNLGRT